MKKSVALIVLACMLMAMSLSAAASVPATPNQRLAFRTGPNTAYVELYTLPESTEIRAIEYEEGNGVTWVFVEFTYNRQLCRAYTGLKRMTVHGNIPWANHIDATCWVGEGGTVYAAPSDRAAYRGYVSSGECITLLDYEGDYAYIEFYDGGTISRGYVPDWMIGYGSEAYDYGEDDDYGEYGGDLAMVPAIPNQRLAFRTGPNTAYVELYTLPQSTSIRAIEYESGNGVTWVQVEFERNGEVVRAYTGLKRMSVQGTIGWANHLYWQVRVGSRGEVIAAPDSRGAYRGMVFEGEYVTLLRYEDGYAYIEFYDGNTPSRGYVPAWMVE